MVKRALKDNSSIMYFDEDDRKTIISRNTRPFRDERTRSLSRFLSKSICNYEEENKSKFDEFSWTNNQKNYMNSNFFKTDQYNPGQTIQRKDNFKEPNSCM